MSGRASKLENLERVEVTDRAQRRVWLKKHHGRTEGIWLVTWKKATQSKHLPYTAIVEEALSFGWIDSLPRKLDEERTMLYISPRKPESVWSRLNKERTVVLEDVGLMTEAGRTKIEAAKKDGTWTILDAAEALEMPEDLVNALAMDRTAKKHFDAFPASARKYILQWIGSARTSGTRTTRIARAVALAARNIRAGMGRP